MRIISKRGAVSSRYLVMSRFRDFDGRHFEISRFRDDVISLFRWAPSLLVMSFALLLLSSCEYKELCYNHNHGSEYNLLLRLSLMLDLNVEIEISEEAHTKIEEPDYMKVCLYDPESGTLTNSEFVRGYGGDLHENPGIYDMVVYSFGTEWTQIRGESDINTLEAFTSDITNSKSRLLASFTRSQDDDASGLIIYTPDHLLVADKEVEIPPFSAENHVITVTATAATIVETYEFEMVNITGIEYISSVEAFVTNQARSNFFGRGEVNTEPATLYFPIEVDGNSETLKTSFNTFGKLPGESKSYLHILIIDSGGTEYRITEDITDQFDKPDHHIIIETPIDIKPPTGEGGGIAPTVEPWEDVHSEVPIG